MHFIRKRYHFSVYGMGICFSLSLLYLCYWGCVCPIQVKPFSRITIIADGVMPWDLIAASLKLFEIMVISGYVSLISQCGGLTMSAVS